MAGVQSSPETETAAAATGEATGSSKAVSEATPNGGSEQSGPHESHPLQFQWSLWHDQPSKNKEWGSGLKEIANFSTVEEFWA